MTIILCAIAIVGMFITFCAGVLWEMNHEEERLSARVIRPANITVNRHYTVTEYTVTDSNALDIDFPDSRRAV